MKISTAEIDKALADGSRVEPAPAEPLENWYYLDESHQLHQLGKDQTFDDAYVEMEVAAANRGHPALTLATIRKKGGTEIVVNEGTLDALHDLLCSLDSPEPPYKHVQYPPDPPKEWVGLTGVEINHILVANVGYPERMMKEVEVLLKEKNNG